MSAAERTITSEETRRIAAAPDAMPDYAKQPELWTARMRARMAAYAKRRGITNNETINMVLIAPSFTDLKLREREGDELALWKIFMKRLRDRKRKTAVFNANQQKKMLPAIKQSNVPDSPDRPVYDTVRRAFMDHYGADLNIVRAWMSAADLYNDSKPLAERFANVTMQAENWAFNRNGEYRMHWNNATHAGHAFWMHAYEAGATHKYPIPFREIVQIVNMALGSVPTVFKYKGSASEATQKFDAFLPGVGLIPDTDAASAIQEDYMQTAVDKKRDDDLNEWFPRPDESKTERDWNSLWPKLNTLYDAYVTPVGRDRREYIHDLLEVKSTKDIPADIDDNTIIRNLKTALSARHQLKVPDVPQSNDKAANFNDSENAGDASNAAPIVQSAPSMTSDNPTPKGNDKTMQSDAIQIALPEAAFVVLFSLYTPGGVEMKYTVRAASGEELDKQVEEYIKRKLAANWTTQRPQLIQPASQMQTAQTGGATAPASNGDESGTLDCVMIEVGTTYTGNKPTLKFACNGREHPLTFSKAPGDMVRLLANVRKFDGSLFTAADLVAGNKFPGMWKVDWQKSKPDNDGKRYDNVMTVRA